MRRAPHLCAAVLFLFAVPAARSQQPSKIVDQYIKAAGGSKTLSKIQTLTLEGALTRPGSNESGTYTFDTRLPNRYYSEILLGQRHFIEAYNGKSAWRQDPAGGIQTVTGAGAHEFAAAAQFYNTHLLYAKKKKLTLTMAGHATVRGRDALQLDVAFANGAHRQAFFDVQSHLLVKESATLAGVEQEILYDDYRPQDGVQLPRKIQLRRGSDTFEITITRAAVNAQVGERVFDFPRGSQVQLPDLKALFKEIEDNQKKIDKILEDYAGTQTVETTELDGSGKSKKHEMNEYQFFFLNGQEIRTLVKKDSKPLADAEQKKENERVQKRIAEAQKQQAKKEAKDEKAKREGKENDDEVSIDTFLRACQFVNPRRERFRGQDVLVFDFEPNPDFKPRKLVERLVHSLAGVVWIDEQAHDVARLEAYFSDNLKIGGGLVASLQKGSSFVFEQAYINNEVWLPTYEEAHVAARVLLFKGIREDEVTRYSDYKKFRVESLSAIGQPKPADPPKQADPPKP
jgi:hypothetical protein